MKKIIAAILALTVFLSLAFAQEDVVLATVNGTPILKSQADSIMPALVNFNYIESEADYDSVVDFLVQEQLIKEKIVEMKFDVFSEEEMNAFLKEAQSEWDKAIANYVQHNLAEDSEQARETAKQKGNEYFTARGFSVERIQNSLKEKASEDKLREYLLGGYKPTNEEVQSMFEKVGEVYKNKYENDIAAYEFETTYMQQKSWYVPEGYRGVLHILLTVDKNILDQYTSAKIAFEEQNSSEGEEKKAVDKEPVDEAKLQAARQMVLDAKKAEMDDIYARLKKGESFVSLMEKYGEDPGMTNPENILKGYPVHAKSSIYDPEFVKGAFSEKMQKVGDVSDPVISSFGIHILYYLSDLQPGLNMSDEIFDEITELLVSQRESEVLEKAFSSWKESAKIEKNQTEIDKAKQEAKERIASKEAEEAEAAQSAAPGSETAATEAPANTQESPNP